MKRTFLKCLILFALFLIPVGAVKAADAKAGDSVYIAKDEIVGGNLYAAGQSIIVDGVINGDLIAAAQTIVVNGQVQGDIIAAGQNITINGPVGGNIRVIGNSVTIDGATARNITAFGNNIVLGANSHVGWDVYLAGANTEIRGIIDGGLNGQAGQTLIAGKIGKDVNLKLSKDSSIPDLSISPETIIGGNLNYSSKNPANISDKASIIGKIQPTIIPAKEVNWLLLYALGRLFAIFAALVVGLVLIFIGKNITPKILTKMQDKPMKMLVPGLAIMFLLPPIAIVLALTLIGIPLALIMMAVWLIAGYLAKILTAILLGKILINHIHKKENSNLLWPLIIGVIICWILFAIPLVGWIFGLIAVWIGLGGIWTYASHQFRNI